MRKVPTSGRDVFIRLKANTGVLLGTRSCGDS